MINHFGCHDELVREIHISRIYIGIRSDIHIKPIRFHSTPRFEELLRVLIHINPFYDTKINKKFAPKKNNPGDIPYAQPNPAFMAPWYLIISWFLNAQRTLSVPHDLDGCENNNVEESHLPQLMWSRVIQFADVPTIRSISKLSKNHRQDVHRLVPLLDSVVQSEIETACNRESVQIRWTKVDDVFITVNDGFQDTCAQSLIRLCTVDGSSAIRIQVDANQLQNSRKGLQTLGGSCLLKLQITGRRFWGIDDTTESEGESTMRFNEPLNSQSVVELFLLGLGMDEAKLATRFFRNAENLEVLEVSGDPLMYPSYVVEIDHLLSRQLGLRRLSVSKMFFDTFGVAHLARHIPDMLEEFVWSDILLDRMDGLYPLAQHLFWHQFLESLTMERISGELNEPPVFGLTHLNPSLTRLRLSGFSRMAGEQKLSFRLSPALEILDLEKNFIEKLYLQNMLPMLTQSAVSLREFKLSRNTFGMNCLLELQQLLSSLTNIRRITLSDNIFFGERHFRELIQSIRDHPNVNHLYISDNMMDAEDWMVLGDLVSSLPSLQILKIENENVDIQSLLAFASQIITFPPCLKSIQMIEMKAKNDKENLIRFVDEMRLQFRMRSSVFDDIQLTAATTLPPNCFI
jgi:hypothetical protein